MRKSRFAIGIDGFFFPRGRRSKGGILPCVSPLSPCPPNSERFPPTDLQCLLAELLNVEAPQKEKILLRI